eukprot:8583201-Alexandrium_andersonii.AAC.1
MTGSFSRRPIGLQRAGACETFSTNVSLPAARLRASTQATKCRERRLSTLISLSNSSTWGQVLRGVRAHARPCCGRHKALQCRGRAPSDRACVAVHLRSTWCNSGTARGAT